MKRFVAAVLTALVICAVPGVSQAFILSINIDWFCNGINEGNDGTVTVNLNKNGTFTTSSGGSGSWGTRLVNGRGIGYLSYDIGCSPLYSIDLTTGEIIFDCRDGATLGPNGWPDARDYSCATTRALNKVTVEPSGAGAAPDATGAWLAE